MVSAGFGIFGGITVLFLPETINTALPNSIEEVEQSHVNMKEDKEQQKILLKQRASNGEEQPPSA